MRVKFYEYFQHLEDSAEKNRDVFSPDDKLPTARTEAKALFRMAGRNGDNLESMRELIQVGETVRHMMFKNAPDKEEVKRMLEFRERVLEVFEELVAKQEKVLEGLALKQEKKALRRSRFLTKRTVPTDAKLTGINSNTIISRKASRFNAQDHPYL